MVLRKQLTKSLDKHQFSLYVSDTAVLLKQGQKCCEIDDTNLVHRVVRVLKLSIGEQFVLFDKKQHFLLRLLFCSKRNFEVEIISHEENYVLQPDITFFLPLLKKEALETAVYSLAEIGINTIQLVVTEKSRKKLLSEKELQRLQKIIIAAAEQSKHYAFPQLRAPQELEMLVPLLATAVHKVVFDGQGDSFFSVHDKVQKSNLCLIVGPEAGLTSSELLFLKNNHFIACTLTQTVLRAIQAVAVGAALFRL